MLSVIIAQLSGRYFRPRKRPCRKLVQLVRNLVNNVSATNIYITADHGFITVVHPFAESDKVSKEEMDAIAEGRRYILTTAR